MARPRQGDGIKRTIVRRGEKHYAYEVTSVMEDGVKKTVSKYLGRVDPATGELLGKIPEKSREHRLRIAEQRDIAILRDIDVGDYGGVHLLDAIQRRIRLGDDLNDSFGSISAVMMAVAITLIQCNGVFDSVQGMMRRTWTRRFYDLAGSFDSGSLSRITKEIGQKAQANMEAFFERRVGRNAGIVAWDTTTVGCHSDMEGMAELVASNKDGEDLKQVKIGLATDLRGVPLMYRVYAGNVSDQETVRLLSEDVRRFGGGDVVHVRDRGFCSGANLKYMLDNGHRFIVPVATSSGAVGKLMTRFRTARGAADMIHRGHAYRVWVTEVGVRADGRRRGAGGGQAYSLTCEGMDGHLSEGGMTAFVCFDSKKFSDEVQAHKRMVADLMAYASRIDAKDPVAAFRRRAGKAARHFDVRADGRRAVVALKPKSESFEVNRAGLFVMLASPGLEWDAVMTSYDARGLAEQAFDRRKGEDRRFRTSDKDSMRGREFIRFLDLILRCEMAAEIREAAPARPFSVEQAVSMADCIQAREFRSALTVKEIDKREREMFGVFKVDPPKEAKTGQRIFDLPE